MLFRSLELCYYIHMNPVKANLVERLEDYAWSSHAAYMHYQQLDWLTVSHIEKLIKNTKSHQACNYKQLIDVYKTEQPEPLFCRTDEDALLIITDTICSKSAENKNKYITYLPIEQILEIVCNHQKLKPEVLLACNHSHEVCFARSLEIGRASCRERV